MLLSPIVDPDQVGPAGPGIGTVPGEALITLNELIGGMSPYGGAGAQALIDSVSEVGASYFTLISRERGRPWIAVVPLADAVTLPACPWPQNVIFIGGFHGGLLGQSPRPENGRKLPGQRLARPGQPVPARPAPSGSGHRGRGHRLADAQLHSACPS